MFNAATIIQAPTGKFIFVGRVPELLFYASYDTLDAAKIAAIDCMMQTGETFPVNVSSQTK